MGAAWAEQNVTMVVTFAGSQPHVTTMQEAVAEVHAHLNPVIGDVSGDHHSTGNVTLVGAAVDLEVVEQRYGGLGEVFVEGAEPVTPTQIPLAVLGGLGGFVVVVIPVGLLVVRRVGAAVVASMVTAVCMAGFMAWWMLVGRAMLA